MEQYTDQLRKISPLSSLGPDQFRTFQQNAELAEFTQGELIYLEGDHDDHVYYLVEGAINRKSSDGAIKPLTHNDDGARYALGNLQPRPHTAQVTSEKAQVVRADRLQVEQLTTRSQMVTGEMPAVRVTDVAEGGELDGAWMFQIVQSEIFRDLPTENIEGFFAAVERVEFKPGDVVVKQGDPGDYYYMIASGRCEVSRKVGRHAFPITTLESGGAFGEEALISGMPRNATVTATEPTVLMRLSKENFDRLLHRPSVKSVNARSAAQAVKQGKAKLIDVRLENEHGARAIRGSVNIPLYQLREKLSELDPETQYILYCDCGARSSTAAFLMIQRGFESSYIEGGLSSMMGGH
ncbi:MAG: cyclic nucleotide-binding domain-containing protein [Xanthomonadales bacterium]|nr:cyclic nucleotide-binding domain-containing protein [Xanthomonadales bacterium]